MHAPARRREIFASCISRCRNPGAPAVAVGLSAAAKDRDNHRYRHALVDEG
jgi:hypothetical protein